MNNWKKYTLILFACMPVILGAADYKTHQTAFRDAIKKNQIEAVRQEAEAMVNLSKNPAANKAPHMERTLNSIISNLKAKPLFLLDLTKKYYDELITILPDGYKKETVRIERAVFLHDLALLDDTALVKVYDAALKGKGLTTADKVRILLLRGKNCTDHKDFARYRDQAMKLAGDDPEALAAVYQASVMNGRLVRPDGHEWARRMIDDKRVQPALFGTINRSCRRIFAPVLGFSYPLKDRIVLLEYALSKKGVWKNEDLCSIYELLSIALMNEQSWKRYYADPDPVVLKKAYTARKKHLELFDRTSAPDMNRLVPAYLALLYVSLVADDQKQFESDVAALTKECAAVKEKWVPTVKSYRVVFAYRQEDYQKAYDIAKNIDTKTFRPGAAGSGLFMDAYARSACALELYPEAYALKDEYVRLCVPNWYYQQKNRVKAQFENIKLMCK